MNTHLKHEMGRLLLNCHTYSELPTSTAYPTYNAASKDKEIIDEEVASYTRETNAEIESTDQRERIPTWV